MKGETYLELKIKVMMGFKDNRLSLCDTNSVKKPCNFRRTTKSSNQGKRKRKPTLNPASTVRETFLKESVEGGVVSFSFLYSNYISLGMTTLNLQTTIRICHDL